MYLRRLAWSWTGWLSNFDSLYQNKYPWVSVFTYPSRYSSFFILIFTWRPCKLSCNFSLFKTYIGKAFFCSCLSHLCVTSSEYSVDVFSMSSYWLFAICSFVLIGCFGSLFGFTTLNRKMRKKQATWLYFWFSWLLLQSHWSPRM